MVNNLIKKVSEFASELKPHVEELINSTKVKYEELKPQVEQLAESLKPHVDQLKAGAEKAFDKAVESGREAVNKTRKYLDDHQEEIEQAKKLAQEATGSAASSMFQFANDTVKFKSNKERLERLKNRIEEQAKEYDHLVHIPGRRIVDTLFVGGDLLSDILRTGASPDVKAAYEAAFPNKAQHISFEDTVRSESDQQILGTISAVKGKLFEQDYVKYLNDGNLPDGYQAEIANSATQPGWDISIHGPSGHISELLQMKATDSIGYVKHALERYPSIDVVTTDEVYSHLLMNGASEHSAAIIDSHISNADLTHRVTDSIDSSAYHMHWTPPVISLAMIAFTTYTLKDATVYEKASHFGSRAGKSYLTYLIGGGVMAMTQTWWLGLVAGIGTRFLAAQSVRTREICEEMEDIVQRNDALLKKMRLSLA